LASRTWPIASNRRGALPRLVGAQLAVGRERREHRVACLGRFAAGLEERAPLALGLGVVAREPFLQRIARHLGVIGDEARVLGAEHVPGSLGREALQPLAPQRLGKRAVGIALEERADLVGIGAMDLAHQQPVRGIWL
jgi:hypothetical protein